ncbi:MAG: class I SAM-dependent methyltransferase [Acidimicrobiales bacterium]
MDRSRSDRDVKAAQASNFDDLNEIVDGTPFDRHLRFLNFGYRVLDGETPRGPKLGFAFPNKDSAQLLFQTIGDTPLDGRRVVEVGCGRGGNLWLVRRYHEVAWTAGIDIAAGSIAHCAKTQDRPDALWAVGGAEDLPLASGIADVLVNVESGATYPDIERFFREAVRVLAVGGRLLYADIVRHDLVDPYCRLLERLGMAIDDQRDISANVVAARDERAERQQLAFATASPQDRATMAEFSGLTGSVLYREFAGGAHRYVTVQATKRAEVAPPADRILTEEERARSRATSDIAVEALTLTSRAGRSDADLPSS